ncbi:DNA-binding transcriptional regulator, MarR family [Methanobrevibacter gottschalkii]|uniref:DNA-binding MarR family transcriptional regulator n=2 Tax=Methanobrevibacter gottschalkii TaxID=190974 RepID=A0A3N5BYQ6_9EURY|nr:MULTISPECIES: MarR family winged helix-turn-helix transcriptional regulator [Methanobrevibacter]MCQ2970551.1 MarR family winged helix-turn-helix transcriptional regulator [archaeon]RPF50985.1 DNA-binding MarR family transcriptional regulator [Methanobrevibacter gottschalkii DSM 11977]SEL08877.1 DNA-binding transcriptional regulator, MarR family [Methanobrevibacter gottschalkii]
MDKSPDVFDNAPIIGWIHNISKNQLKYLNSQIQELNLGREVRYIMLIHDNPNCSQDDLVNIYGESKANVAKSLKKLENNGYITRNMNPENRRKYMLKTTKKADELIPKIRKISLDWEIKVGIDENDYELKEKIRQIAINGMKLIDNN